jgi:hypothetical protein
MPHVAQRRSGGSEANGPTVEFLQLTVHLGLAGMLMSLGAIAAVAHTILYIKNALHTALSSLSIHLHLRYPFISRRLLLFLVLLGLSSTTCVLSAQQLREIHKEGQQSGEFSDLRL